MLSCKKATELIEKKSLIGISFKEKIQLRMHKSICDACTAYEKESLWLDKMLRQHVCDHHEENITLVENKDLKENIISKL